MSSNSPCSRIVRDKWFRTCAALIASPLTTILLALKA